MAGRTRKTATDENEVDLREQVRLLQEQLNMLLSKKEEVGSSVNDEKIAQDDYINVMSLRPETLVLTTELYGKGRIFTFEKFGQVKRILYSELVKIMEIRPNFLEDGFYYIMDKRVIRAHGLDEFYDKILTKEKIEKILETNEDAIELFKMANNVQQRSIVSMIVEKATNGEEMDMNIIDKLSNLIKLKAGDKDISLSDVIKDQKFNVEYVVTK